MLHLVDCKKKFVDFLMGNKLGPLKHGRFCLRTSSISRRKPYFLNQIIHLEKYIFRKIQNSVCILDALSYRL